MKDNDNKWILNDIKFEEGKGTITTYTKETGFNNTNFTVEVEEITCKYNKTKQRYEGTLISTRSRKEYFVDFKDGKEIPGSRKRTFEGVRLMIIGF